MFIDVERLMQLLIALLMGCIYYFFIISKLKQISVLLLLIVVWLAGFMLFRDGFMALILALNNGIYPLSLERHVILGQDIFLSLLIFSIGQLKFANDAS